MSSPACVENVLSSTANALHPLERALLPAALCLAFSPPRAAVLRGGGWRYAGGAPQVVPRRQATRNVEIGAGEPQSQPVLLAGKHFPRHSVVAARGDNEHIIASRI